jgi:uncharacterized protein YjbI with pentapeptide repeats
MTRPRARHARWPYRGGFALAWGLVVASSFIGVSVPSQQSPPSPCPASQSAGGHDYHGLTLTKCNFNGRDLRHADFTGATLDAVVFVHADLSDADFSGATLKDSGRALPTDFSYANLTRAKFIGAKFEGRTYLTQATLDCTDFSKTDISQGHAIFGDHALTLGDPQVCRTRFQHAVMNCEFVAQWNRLDLTSADLSRCLPKAMLMGLDLSNAMLDNVNLYQANLEGTTLNGAQLHGATLSQVNLKNAKLIGAQLGIPPGGQPSGQRPATLIGAYAPGVDFTNADLRSVDLTGAHLYRSATRRVDFTGARLDSADFSQALLPEAVFTGSLTSAVFNQAVLVNAVFPGADLTNAKFVGAYLQGTDFSGTARIVGASLGDSAVSDRAGAWSYTDKDGTPTVYGYKASVLGAFATLEGATCPSATPSPCTGTKLTPSGTGPYPAQPACTPLPPDYDNCLPPTQSTQRGTADFPSRGLR